MVQGHTTGFAKIFMAASVKCRRRPERKMKVSDVSAAQWLTVCRNNLKPAALKRAAVQQQLATLLYHWFENTHKQYWLPWGFQAVSWVNRGRGDPLVFCTPHIKIIKCNVALSSLKAVQKEFFKWFSRNCGRTKKLWVIQWTLGGATAGVQTERNIPEKLLRVRHRHQLSVCCRGDGMFCFRLDEGQGGNALTRPFLLWTFFFFFFFFITSQRKKVDFISAENQMIKLSWMEEKKVLSPGKKTNPVLTKCTFTHLRTLLIPQVANCQEELLEESANTQNSRRPAEKEAKRWSGSERENIVNI